MAIKLQLHGKAACRGVALPASATVNRRKAWLLLLGAPLIFAGNAQARDAEAAKAAAEERRRKLREAAEATVSSGKDTEAFEDSNYSLSEEARTPNIHSRQGEGAKTQINV